MSVKCEICFEGEISFEGKINFESRQNQLRVERIAGVEKSRRHPAKRVESAIM